MEKEKIILFGAGGSGKKLFVEYAKNEDICVVAFCDNFKEGELMGLPIIKPIDLLTYEYDSIVIASVAATSIEKQLIDLGIKRSKICRSYIGVASLARDTFLKQFADECKRKNLQGNVAEAGVFQGDFAVLINKYFHEKTCYLFDTFEGFDARDIEKEENYQENPTRGDYFKMTSVEVVRSKLQNPERCIIKKGYVPETFEGIEDQFCFVNLDMDLYQPTLEALKWFWPKMVDEGVILVHDYFDESGTYPNLKKAVIKFVEENNIRTMPIGDNLSIALIK